MVDFLEVSDLEASWSARRVKRNLKVFAALQQQDSEEVAEARDLGTDYAKRTVKKAIHDIREAEWDTVPYQRSGNGADGGYRLDRNNQDVRRYGADRAALRSQYDETEGHQYSSAQTRNGFDPVLARRRADMDHARQIDEIAELELRNVE